MGKYKKCEIELSPQLLKKLFEHVKKPDVPQGDLVWIIENIKELCKCGDLLTLDEFEMIITKPTA